MRSHEEAARAVKGLTSKVRREVSAGQEPLLASVWDEQTYRILMMRDNLRQYADNMRKASSWFEKHKHTNGMGPEGRLPCRFFALGHGCIFGVNCKFAHGMNLRGPPVVNGAAGVPPSASAAVPGPVRPMGGMTIPHRTLHPTPADGEVNRPPLRGVDGGQPPEDARNGPPPPLYPRGGGAGERGGRSDAFGGRGGPSRPLNPQHHGNHGMVRDPGTVVNEGGSGMGRGQEGGRTWLPEDRERRVLPNSDIDKARHNGRDEYMAERGPPHAVEVPRREMRDRSHGDDRRPEHRGWHHGEPPAHRGDAGQGIRYRSEELPPHQSQGYPDGSGGRGGRSRHPAERKVTASIDSRGRRRDSPRREMRTQSHSPERAPPHMNGIRGGRDAQRKGGDLARGGSGSKGHPGHHDRSDILIFGSEEEFGSRSRSDRRDRDGRRWRGRSPSGKRGYRGDGRERAERESRNRDGRGWRNRGRDGESTGGTSGRERGGKVRDRSRDYNDRKAKKSTSKTKGKIRKNRRQRYGKNDSDSDFDSDSDSDERSSSPFSRGGRDDRYRDFRTQRNVSDRGYRGKRNSDDEQDDRDRHQERRNKSAKRARSDSSERGRPERRPRNRRDSYNAEPNSEDDDAASISRSHASSKKRTFAAPSAAPAAATTFTVTANAVDLPPNRQSLPLVPAAPVEVPPTRFSITVPPSMQYALARSPRFADVDQEQDATTWEKGGRGPGGRGSGGRGRGFGGRGKAPGAGKAGDGPGRGGGLGHSNGGRGTGGRGGRGRGPGRGRGKGGGYDQGQRPPAWM